MHVKNKSCNSLQDFRTAPLLEIDFNMVSFREYSKSFMEQLWLLLLNYVLASERIFKKKASWEIAFELISLFHVEIQEPTAYKYVNYQESICRSCKISRILLSKNIWNKNLMTT